MANVVVGEMTTKLSYAAGTLTLAELSEWREMVRLFLDRGDTLNKAIRSADDYITAVRTRSKPDAT